MNLRSHLTLLAVLTALLVATVMGQPVRKDAIWARTVPAGTITLDGMLNEAAWASAESVEVRWGNVHTAYEPGSGYRAEQGASNPSDPTNAKIKFLVSSDNKMYVAIWAKDSSIGGGMFNKFDGLLMNIRDRSKADRPVPAYEYFYGWVTEGWADTSLGQPGKLPGFFGWAGGKRTDSTGGVLNSNIWNAVTKVYGTTNDDSKKDTAWVTELMFNLTLRGYDVTQANGDIVMYNISIYDADWQWPLDTVKFAGNRTWLQGPWGNGNGHNHIRIFARPTVTTSSGAAPSLEPDFVIPQASANPVIDGNLNDAVWSQFGASRVLKIKYGDNTLRNSYKYTMPYRSGQFQPSVWGAKPDVLDPAEADVKMFFNGDTLYIGIDVKDNVVQYRPEFDRQDGFRLMIKDRTKRVDGEYHLEGYEIYIRVDSGATRYALDGFARNLAVDTFAVGQRGNKIALALKTGTTIDTVGATNDNGYSIEMKINLRAIGYPAGRGDGIVYFGALVNDGDTFGSSGIPAYGNRVWYAQEGSWPDGPALAYMNPSVTTDVAGEEVGVPGEFRLNGSYPNPFNPEATIDFTIPSRANVRINVYDVLGRLVDSQTLLTLSAGRHGHLFNGASLASGVYFYQVQLLDLTTNNVLDMKSGRMLLVK